MYPGEEAAAVPPAGPKALRQLRALFGCLRAKQAATRRGAIFWTKKDWASGLKQRQICGGTKCDAMQLYVTHLMLLGAPGEPVLLLLRAECTLFKIFWAIVNFF